MPIEEVQVVIDILLWYILNYLLLIYECTAVELVYAVRPKLACVHSCDILVSAKLVVGILDQEANLIEVQIASLPAIVHQRVRLDRLVLQLLLATTAYQIMHNLDKLNLLSCPV